MGNTKILAWVMFCYLPMFTAFADEPIEPVVKQPPVGESPDKERGTAEQPVPIMPRAIKRLPPPVPTTSRKHEPGIAAVPEPVVPAAPTPLTSCDPGGCWDASGKRYNSSGANTYLDKSGHPCNRNGIWVQCF